MITDNEVNDALSMLQGDPERFRPMLEAEAVLRRICKNAKAKAEREGVPPWSIVSDWTGHGSGVSAAIYRLYGARETGDE